MTRNEGKSLQMMTQGKGMVAGTASGKILGKISVALLPRLLPHGWHTDATQAVVIDTLRFTSTAAVALAAGARSIQVLSDIQRAKELAEQRRQHPDGGKVLLCGERKCIRIPGFDLGNSPAEYKSEIVQGADLIFSTTNGTVAVEAASQAPKILLGSLLNRASVAAQVDQELEIASASHIHAWVICAGTDGEIAQEDVLTAGAIVHCLLQTQRWHCANPSAQEALQLFVSTQTSNPHAAIMTVLREAPGGRNLIQAGFAHDLDLVSHLDELQVVPVMNGPHAPSSTAHACFIAS